MKQCLQCCCITQDARSRVFSNRDLEHSRLKPLSVRTIPWSTWTLHCNIWCAGSAAVVASDATHFNQSRCLHLQSPAVRTSYVCTAGLTWLSAINFSEYMTKGEVQSALQSPNTYTQMFQLWQNYTFWTLCFLCGLYYLSSNATHVLGRHTLLSSPSVYLTSCVTFLVQGLVKVVNSSG